MPKFGGAKTYKELMDYLESKRLKDNARSRAWRLKNIEKERLRNRLYYQEHRDEMCARRTALRQQRRLHKLAQRVAESVLCAAPDTNPEMELEHPENKCNAGTPGPCLECRMGIACTFSPPLTPTAPFKLTRSLRMVSEE